MLRIIHVSGPPVYHSEAIVGGHSTETQPYAQPHEPHHRGGILVSEKLAIESQHPLVLVPLHEDRPGSAAGSLVG